MALLCKESFNVPHRTGREDFQHPALQQDSQTRRQRVQLVDDTRLRQWVVPQIRIEADPIERDFLTPPIDPFENQPPDSLVIAVYHPAVTTNAIVLVMASQLGL